MKDYTHRKACYLCTTPLQILGAMAFELQDRQGADLFLFDDLKSYREIGEKLRDTGIFENVYCVRLRSSLISGKKRLTRMFFFLRMMTSSFSLNSVLDKGICYDRLYTSSSAMSKMIILNALSKRNAGMEIIMYDDGIGSYSKAARVKTGSELFRKAKKLLNWSEALEHSSEVYLYCPELAEPEAGKTIRRMPAIMTSEENREIVRNVFCGQQKNVSIDEKVIIFDTFRKTADNRPGITELDSLYEKAKEVCGEKNIILKAHPRSSVESRAAIKQYTEKQIPMEIVYMGTDHLEDKILVALNSTAVFTPKMFFDKEPRIILLYRLVHADAAVRKKRDELYGKLTGMYEHQERISIPETEEEYRRVLAEWSAT